MEIDSEVNLFTKLDSSRLSTDSNASQLEEAQTKIRQLEEVIANLQTGSAESSMDAETVGETDVSIELDSLREYAASLEEELKRKTEENDALLTEKDQIFQQLEIEMGANSEHEQEMLGQIENLTNENKSLVDRLETFGSSDSRIPASSAASEMVETLKIELAAKEEEILSLSEDNEILREGIASKTKLLEFAKGEIESRTESVAQLKEMIDSYESQLSSRAAEMEELKLKLVDVEATAKSSCDDLSEGPQVLELTAANKELKDHVSLLEEDLRVSSEFTDMLMTQMEELKSSKQELEAELARAESELLKATMGVTMSAAKTVEAETAVAEQDEMETEQHDISNDITVTNESVIDEDKMNLLLVVKELETKLETTSDEIVAIQTLLDQKTMECRELEALRLEADRRSSTFSDEMALLKVSNEELALRSAQLQDDLAASKSSLDLSEGRYASDMERMRSVVVPLEMEISDLKTQLEQIGASAAEDEASRDSIQDLQTQNSSLTEKLAFTSTSLQDANASLEIARQESVHLTNSVTEIQGNVVSLTEEIVQLNSAIVTLETKNAALEEEKSTLQSSLAEACVQVSSLTEEVCRERSVQVQLAAEIATLAEDNAALKRDLEVKEAEIEAKSGEVSALEASVCELEACIAEKTAVIEQMQTQDNSASENREGLIAELQTALAEKDLIVSEQQRVIEGKESFIAENAAAIATKDQIIADFESATAANDVSVQNLQCEMIGYQRQLETLSADLQDQRDATLAAEDQCKAMKAQILNLQQRPETVMGMSQVDIDNTKKESERAVQQATVELGKKDGEISRLMVSLTSLSERAEVAERALLAYQSSEQSTIEGEEGMKKKIGQLQTTVDLLKGEKDSLMAKVSGLEKEVKKLLYEKETLGDKLQAQNASLQAQLAQKESAAGDSSLLLASIKSLEGKIQMVKEERDELSSNLEAACAKIDELEAENQQLASAVDEQVVAELEAAKKALFEAKSVEQATAERAAGLESQVSEMTMRLKKNKEETSMLQQELADLNETVDQLKSMAAEMDNLKSERDELLVEVEKSAQQVAELTEALIEADSLNTAASANSDGETMESLKQELVEVLQSFDAMSAKAAEAGQEVDGLKAELEAASNAALELQDVVNAKQG
jgi:chromosome segregation ATPase